MGIACSSHLRFGPKENLLKLPDASNGKTLWSRAIEGGDYKTHNFNNLASGTPSVTDSLVIIGWLDVLSKRAKFSAYTHDGDIAWQQDLGPHVSQHGVSFNPVIFEDYIVINHAHMDGGTTGVYRLEDGASVWSQAHPKGPKGIKTSYVSPLIREREDTGLLRWSKLARKSASLDSISRPVRQLEPADFNHRPSHRPS